MDEAILKTSSAGAILCDASIAAQVGDDWFDPLYWQVGAVAGGRGSAWRVQTPAGAAVLRHYRRGGAIARLLGDRYWWQQAERTRPFAEFRLLQRLQSLCLPAPQPLAARYQRGQFFYRADLLTRLVANAATLAERLAAGRADAAAMQRVGATIARFHAAGVWHADLNAHNVLLVDTTESAPSAAPHAALRVYLIDFDRGELRAGAGDWPEQNLARLRRSLLKLGAAADGEAVFERALWQPLRVGYLTARQQADMDAAGAAGTLT
ncbi:MAG: 3-deoxy-D-manno-octulosonic acid kinase [Rhodanobacteraceae bacterium]|nr:3-deoxy-D-manno-octulosonic acid kinase [Rhodanobacteraceae bacterium]